MKRIITLLLIATTMTVSAQETAEGKYTIENGPLTMTIDAARGAKITSFKLGDKEIISQLRWPESWGSTFWTSPQKEWNWPPVPEYDKRPYTVEKTLDGLRMTSEVNERLKMRISKTFATDENDGAIVITYTIKNESDETRRVAPWEITRVENESGLIFFEAPADGIWPADLMTFKNVYGAAWYTTDEAQQNRKVNADGRGWLAYCSRGLLLIKRFPDISKEEPAPNEAEIQVYVNRGRTYIELESQGAYTELAPRTEFSWTVRWYLLPCDATAEPSEALMQKVKGIIK